MPSIDVVLIPAAPVAGKGLPAGWLGNAGHDVNLVACGRPLAAMLVGAVGGRVDLGREVVREEQDPHVRRAANQ